MPVVIVVVVMVIIMPGTNMAALSDHFKMCRIQQYVEKRSMSHAIRQRDR
jgi:hypothetical protein